jgi:hypothetical protein
MFEEFSKSPDLELFVSENSDKFWLFCSSGYEHVKQEKHLINEFVLSNIESLQSLDFSNGQNRAFLIQLYDICERLEDAESMQQLWIIIKSNLITTGSRLLAANIFSFQISFAHELVDQFTNICDKLVFALEHEEDDNRKVLATFANYYVSVLGRPKKWIDLLRDKIHNSTEKYTFLSSKFISELLSYDTSSFEECNKNIQGLKDDLFERIEKSHAQIDEDFIIEEGEYANNIAAIKNISFQNLRSIALKNISGSLTLGNRGVTPLTSYEELFLYLRNYGNMHYAKMLSALEELPLNSFEKEIEIIDWGCGQAIASLTLFEFLKKKSISLIPTITLIEPSEITLKRASLHCKIFDAKVKIKTVCKFLDELQIADISTKTDSVKFHLFSNILDIELFSMSNLLELISSSQKGTNYFICVSPYINDIKVERIDSFKRYFENQFKSFLSFGNKQNTNSINDDYWNCNNRFNGNFDGKYCDQSHPLCGCFDQWTRVIRVFKVDF